jgi:hypothetical protein
MVTKILKIEIHNALTNDVIEREMNSEELAQYELDKVAAENRKIQEEIKTQAKAAVEAKLALLGLTADDLKTIVG